MTKETWFLVGLIVGVLAMLLLVPAVRLVHIANLEHRAMVAIEDADLTPLMRKAIGNGKAIIFTADDGQLLLYYEDSGTQGTLYLLGLK